MKLVKHQQRVLQARGGDRASLIVNGCAFNWANVSALANTAAVTVNSGGAFNLATDGTIDALTGGGLVNVNASTLRVGFNNATTNFAGAVTGTGTLSKMGAGTWTLTGAGSALGNLVVNNGTLALSGGSLKATNLFVNTGSQFALNGGTLTVNNATINNNADFMVGNGTLAANFTVLAGGVASFQQNLIVTIS